MSNVQDDRHVLSRLSMVEEIRMMAYEDRNYLPSGEISEKVLSIIATVPRHRFVPAGEMCSAYCNHPLPIGFGQTISQPFIVALMTELLALEQQDRILEIGTGSGYQTAILAAIVDKVYSMEIVESLSHQAGSLLAELGYSNVQLKIGNGHWGWPEYAPYDGIIVTAAAERIPPLLLSQLKNGGHMVIPVGRWAHVQDLILIKKSKEGLIHQQNILPVSFVPLTGGV